MFLKSELKGRKDMVVLNIDWRKAVICEGISRDQDLKDVAWEIAELLGWGRNLIYKKQETTKSFSSLRLKWIGILRLVG